MSDFTTHAFGTDADEAPTRPGQLSSNGHWIFGSVFAGLVVTGLAFGLWVGVAKTKPVESVEKQKDNTDKPVTQPPPKPPVTPVVEPKVEPKPEPPKPEPPKPEPPKPEQPKPEPPKKDPPMPPAKAVAFTEVKPVLMKYCGNCHGLSAGEPKGGIDLRSVAAIMKGGKNGDILKAGDAMKSTLYTSLLPGAREFMPPDDKPGPTKTEIDLIRDWIASGAKPRRTIRRRDTRCKHDCARVELTPEPPTG